MALFLDPVLVYYNNLYIDQKKKIIILYHNI